MAPSANPAAAAHSTSPLRHVARILLAVLLLVAGVGHFVAAQTFLAQVPSWLPWRMGIVYVSGAVEIVLGLALLLAPARFRPPLGWLAAAFFVAVFPGNVAQYVEGTDAFGLDTDRARLTRLFFQPVLVLMALWSTDAWRRRGRSTPSPANSS